MNDYIYTERSGVPCVEYPSQDYTRVLKDLTSEEFESFVEFKTMQHNQTQKFLKELIEG